MPHLAPLLDRWAHEPGQPRLTWYGPEAERVELTGRVLGTWVAKAANLLADEADVHTGTTVRLDLPAHWRAAVWALASWACGASLTLDEQPEADILVTSRIASPSEAEVVIMIALPALAMTTDDVPPGVVDGASEAMSHPDLLIQPVPSPGARLASGGMVHDLLEESIAEAPAERTLLRVARPGASNPAEVAQMLRAMVRTWSSGGSIVLLADPDADVDRIAAQESAQPIG
ncbi:TIGR03089 family protein [Ruania halotolerans]|uniref:TIGR03089 family protein n=1 Tax=Ruania halotolerans TaxID=2897773 RepID=UPI001E5C6D76|nr:TIGR03089 family protein [Ruania halotolerans]UFU07557.1 TIGR03089 family protein [Ruania halotolerans]